MCQICIEYRAVLLIPANENRAFANTCVVPEESLKSGGRLSVGPVVYGCILVFVAVPFDFGIPLTLEIFSRKKMKIMHYDDT